MTDFVLHRTHVHRSLQGHVINFIKNEPVYVPPVCHKEVVAIGAVPTSDERIDPLGDELEPVTPLTPDERNEQLVKAFKLLEDRNNRTDFTGQGVPSIPALKKMVDFEVDKKEVEELWRGYREDQAS